MIFKENATKNTRTNCCSNAYVLKSFFIVSFTVAVMHTLHIEPWFALLTHSPIQKRLSNHSHKLHITNFKFKPINLFRWVSLHHRIPFGCQYRIFALFSPALENVRPEQEREWNRNTENEKVLLSSRILWKFTKKIIRNKTDHGCGNLFSLQKNGALAAFSCSFFGEKCTISEK